MAKLASISVACPECGDSQELEVTSESQVVDDSLVLTFTPVMDPMIEHFVIEHAAEAI